MRRLAVPVALAAALLAVPSFADDFQLALLTQGVAWSILGVGVWLLLRVCDLPSFGHAAFFGTGAYVAGLAVTRWEMDSVLLALGLAVVVSCVVALPIAIVAGRLKHVGFLLITLAFANMLHALAGRWQVLGGSDGLVGVVRPDAAPLPLELSQPVDFYLFALIVLAAALIVVLVVVRSPFGAALKGIRESEQRMAALGYNPVPYRVAAFVISAGIAGAAGVVNAYLNRFVDPGDLDALVSARALLIVVIGGTSVFGAPIAAIAITVLEDTLSSHTARWLGVMGALYILVALVTPDREGLRRLWAHVRALAGRPAAPATPALAPAKEPRR
jgi:branched-chain amino acid transport system permease protein